MLMPYNALRPATDPYENTAATQQGIQPYRPPTMQTGTDAPTPQTNMQLHAAGQAAPPQPPAGGWQPTASNPFPWLAGVNTGGGNAVPPATQAAVNAANAVPVDPTTIPGQTPGMGYAPGTGLRTAPPGYGYGPDGATLVPNTPETIAAAAAGHGPAAGYGAGTSSLPGVGGTTNIPTTFAAATGTPAAPAGTFLSHLLGGGATLTPGHTPTTQTTTTGTQTPATQTATGTTPPAGSGFDILNYLTGRLNSTGGAEKGLYDYLKGNIDDQYALQRQQLGEEMARRGLGASTIYGGRLNDLNIGQRAANAQLGGSLLQNEQQNARDWLGQLMGYGQQGFQNDVTTQMMNQQAQNQWQNYILSLLGMGYSPTG